MDYSFTDEKTDAADEPKPKTEIVKADPLDPTHLEKRFSEFDKILEDMESKADNHEVTDDQSSADCGVMAAQARKVFNQIEKKRKAVLSPYQTVVKSVNGCCNAIKGRLTAIQRKLEKDNRPYLVEKERKRREAEQKAIEEARKESAEQLEKQQSQDLGAGRKSPSPPVVVNVASAPAKKTKIDSEYGSQGIQKEWTYEIVDLMGLPVACFEARAEQIAAAVKPWINAQIKAGVREVEGVRIFQKDVVKTRAK